MGYRPNVLGMLSKKEEKLKNSVSIIEGIKSGKGSEGQDARMLGEFLKMIGREPDVCEAYKAKKASRDNFLNVFLDSDFRFLHVSSHGDKRGFRLQDLNKTKINSDDIREYCKGKETAKRPYKPLRKKFLTISACGHVSGDFVNELHRWTGVTAVISALAPVWFADSALFSSLFYFSLFKDMDATKPENLSQRIAMYVDAYQRTKAAYLSIGGIGAHRLDYWWNDEHIIVN